jgi:hypothetical protein
MITTVITVGASDSTNGLATLAVALIGGAIGSVLTALFGLGARMLGARREVAAHDRFVSERDEDLASWVSDRSLALTREIETQVKALAARGAFTSGETNYSIALLKERALHEYRDQERQAERDVALIRDTETWMHTRWRSRDGLPFPELGTPEAAEPVLGAWRSSVTRYDGPTEVVDPARRTLEATVQELQSTGIAAYV